MIVGALRVKLQLKCGDRYALGPGKADLLDAIASQGSISAAGRALGMSYRRAWLLIDEMNRCFSEPLVATTKGGGTASGARLSAAGRSVLDAYRALDAQAATAADSPAYEILAKLLRKDPLSHD